MVNDYQVEGKYVMQEVKKEFNIAVIRNNTTIKQVAKEWGIHPMVLYRVSSGAAKSKRILEKINQYIGGEE